MRNGYFNMLYIKDGHFTLTTCLQTTTMKQSDILISAFFLTHKTQTISSHLLCVVCFYSSKSASCCVCGAMLTGWLKHALCWTNYVTFTLMAVGRFSSLFLNLNLSANKNTQKKNNHPEGSAPSYKLKLKLLP